MKRFFIIWFFLFSAFLSGCAQTAPNLPEDTNKPDPLPAELTFSEDVFSHSHNAPDAVCYDWLEAQIYQFRVDDAKAVFFENDPIVSSEDHDYGNRCVYMASGASGAYLLIEYNSAAKQTMLYRTHWYNSKADLLVKNYPADIGAFNLNNAVELPQEELAFATAQEAEAAVKEALGQLGCGNIGAAEVYSLNPATLAALERDDPRVDDNGKELPMQSWTDEDACYYLVFRGEYDGLVFAREGLQWEGTNITAYYSSRGIEGLQIQTPLEITGVGQEIDMPSTEDVKAMISRKYDSIILTNAITIEAISLEYIMVPSEGRLLPSWRVIVSEDCGEYQYKSYLRFNALTGEQMIW